MSYGIFALGRKRGGIGDDGILFRPSLAIHTGDSALKFDCGLTIAEKTEKYKEWHDYFAILPVRVGYRDCRWLEIVRRKGSYIPFKGSFKWEYQAKKVKK